MQVPVRVAFVEALRRQGFLQQLVLAMDFLLKEFQSDTDEDFILCLQLLARLYSRRRGNSGYLPPSELVFPAVRENSGKFSVPDVARGEPSLAREMCHFACGPLLALSQVCAWWHSVALESRYPFTVVSHRPRSRPVNRPDPQVNHIMELLRSALERSGTHPLSGACVIWKTLTCIAGGGRDGLLPLENFRDSPRLKSIGLHGIPDDNGDLEFYAQLPWEQLSEVWCLQWGMPDNESFLTVIVMPRLSQSATLFLHFSLSHWDPENGLTSDSFSNYPDSRPPVHAKWRRCFFATLILLSLKRLVFMVKDGRLHLPVPWPGPQFLSLSERSSFPSHLASLLLYNVAISERELLQTLAIFPALKHLALSDHPELPLDGSVEQVLLSDTLVANSSPSPAPRFPVSHPGPALPPLPVPAPIRRQHLSELRAFEGAG
ncbi:hypothetical protein B0H14DRAFT_2595350 [Mycena olivaceomarginata]|nr:hypothetical protein B0H14DRAFT_2595350 [Mycena olivaceomarginata]